MRAFITGSAGFCGRHLFRYLDNQGVQTYGLSLVAEGDRVFANTDVHDVEGLAQILANVRPDYIFHLAGILKSKKPWEIFEVNVGLTLTLFAAIEQARLGDVRVLNAGSCAEYGEVPGARLPVSEDYPCSPVSHYGISKLAQAQVALAASSRGIRTVSTRTANILGPGMPDTLFAGTVVRQLCEIRRGERACLELGNLNAARDFIDISDTVRLYWRLINTPAAEGQIVNVSSGSAIPIRTLLDKIVEKFGTPVRIVTQNERLRSDDLPAFCASNLKLKSLTGETPEVDLDRTVESIVESERQR